MKNGQGLHQYLQVGGYATRAVLPEASVIPIRKDAPLDVVSLVSCGVLAGAGPVINKAKVPPGASVAVFGCGGVGLNTIQAARLVGAARIIAVDVMKQKLEWALEFGATHVVDARRRPGRRGAADRRGRWRRLCLRGSGPPANRGAGLQLHAPGRHHGGRRGCPTGTRISIDPTMLLQQRVLTGSSFGAGHQRTDVPMLIDLFMDGRYKLRELISRRVPLGEVNQAYEALLQGEVKRSVVVFD